MAYSCSGLEESKLEEDHESSLSRREVDEQINYIINPPSCSDCIPLVMIPESQGQEEEGLKPCVAHPQLL